jgi:hypothetical protein
VFVHWKERCQWVADHNGEFDPNQLKAKLFWYRFTWSWPWYLRLLEYPVKYNEIRSLGRHQIRMTQTASDQTKFDEIRCDWIGLNLIRFDSITSHRIASECIEWHEVEWCEMTWHEVKWD